MANPSDIQMFLEGIKYPKDKDGIVMHAAERGAPPAIIAALGTIPDREYDSAADVSSELDINNDNSTEDVLEDGPG